jgi:hypothetical protein
MIFQDHPLDAGICRRPFGLRQALADGRPSAVELYARRVVSSCRFFSGDNAVVLKCVNRCCCMLWRAATYNALQHTRSITICEGRHAASSVRREAAGATKATEPWPSSRKRVLGASRGRHRAVCSGRKPGDPFLGVNHCGLGASPPFLVGHEWFVVTILATSSGQSAPAGAPAFRAHSVGICKETAGQRGSMSTKLANHWVEILGFARHDQAHVRK